MGQDIYARLGDELRALFKDLNPLNPKRVHFIREEMDRIQRLASRLGSPLQEEAMRLGADVEKYLKNPENPKLAAILKEHALRLHRETREL